ncbi:hypothetical protein Tco_0039376 [Tanacetum coccineum]
MFESRQKTIPFLSRLNDYYCDEKKGSYGLQCLDTYSYGATRIDDSLTRKEKDPGSFTLPCYINNVCFENALADLGASNSEISKGIAENVLAGISKFFFPVDFIILDMPEDVKVPLILERPFCLPPTLRLILRERMELDLEVRLMGETLVLNRLLDPLYGDYIKLNDLNVPLELRRDQVDDLMPIIKEVVENMDGYRDQDMGDVIFGEPFRKASCVEERRPLLKVSLDDKMNGISHPYQKLKSFYKGVLNLGLEYIRDAKMEE